MYDNQNIFFILLLLCLFIGIHSQTNNSYNLSYSTFTDIFYSNHDSQHDLNFHETFESEQFEKYEIFPFIICLYFIGIL